MIAKDINGHFHKSSISIYQQNLQRSISEETASLTFMLRLVKCGSNKFYKGQ